MKKVLMFKLSLALCMAMTAMSWAQEPPQPVVGDTIANAAVVEGAVAAESFPMMQSAPMMASDCGCGQTFTMSPYQSYASPIATSAPMTTMSSAGCGCGNMIGQVGYNEIIQTATPTASPIVASTPTTILAQPNGCCGPVQSTYAPSVVATPTSFAQPMTQCCPTPQPRWANNQCYDPCDPCAQQQRGLFRGRFFGRR